MRKILLLADQLEHYYGHSCAVKNISFSLQQGDILGLLGPNGAGKSTTMKMLCGVLPLHQGQIKINDFDLLDHAEEAKQEIGYLPEQPPLYNELTVSEYLGYSAQLRRIPNKRLNTARQIAMERCGLHDVQHKLIGQLSKGYQQRVGIAQAIIHNPSVIILDEPTVGLDPIQIRQIRQLIRELGEDHGLILSTHILPEVQAVCKQVKIIHQGRLVYSDTLDALQQEQCKQTLILRLQRPPQISELQKLPYVQQLDTMSEGQFTLQVSNLDEAAEQLAILSVNNNWGLRELSPHTQSLENIFVSLTSNDEKNQLESVQ